MTTCSYEDRIQAYLDGELPRVERKELALHLETCADCRDTLHALKRLGEWSENALRESFALPPQAQSQEIDVEAAWMRLQQRLTAQRDASLVHPNPNTRGRWIHMAKTYKKWLVGTAAAAVLFGSFAIPQVQAAADELLSMFRVEKIQSIQITPQDLNEMQQWISAGTAGELNLQGLGKLWSDDPSRDMVSYNTLQQAEAAGITPTVPKGFDVSMISVRPSYTLNFQLNTDSTNALLKQLGSKVAFDPKLNNKQFSIQFPQSVTTDLTSNAHPDQSFSYTAFDSPNMVVPKDVDMNSLRETVLQLPMLPEHIRQQLASIDQWQTTLPVPNFAGSQSSLTKVTVNGVEGLFTNRTEAHDAMLLWQKNGQVHMLNMSYMKDDAKVQDTLLALANLLK